MLIVLVVLFAFKNNLKAGNVPESGKATVLLNSPFAEPKESTLNVSEPSIWHLSKECLSLSPLLSEVSLWSHSCQILPVILATDKEQKGG